MICHYDIGVWFIILHSHSAPKFGINTINKSIHPVVLVARVSSPCVRASPHMNIVRGFRVDVVLCWFLRGESNLVYDIRREDRVWADRGAEMGGCDHFGDIHTDVYLIVLHPLFWEAFV